MKQGKTNPNAGLRGLIDELYGRVAKLATTAANIFAVRVRAVGGNYSGAMPNADGPAAIALTLPPLTCPIGSKVNINGILRVSNTTVNAKQVQVQVELVAGGPSVGDWGNNNFNVPINTNAGVPIPFNCDYVTTSATTTFLISAFCNGGAPGDLTLDLTNVATAVRVG